MSDKYIIVEFNSRYKPLPPGYVVMRVDDHFIGMTLDEVYQSNIHWDKYQARRWCFAHYTKTATSKIPPKIDVDSGSVDGND